MAGRPARGASTPRRSKLLGGPAAVSASTSHDGALSGDELRAVIEDRRRHRHPFPHPAPGRRAGGRGSPAGDRLLLQRKPTRSTCRRRRCAASRSFNAPYASTRSVAELVVGEIVHAAAAGSGAQRGHACRPLAQALARCARGPRQDARNRRLRAHRHAGRPCSPSSLACRCVFFDAAPRLALGNAKAVSDFGELLAVSDVVDAACPRRRRRREGLLSTRELAAMRRGAVLVNASRASAVDMAALVAALESGTPRGRGPSTSFPMSPAATMPTSSRHWRGSTTSFSPRTWAARRSRRRRRSDQRSPPSSSAYLEQGGDRVGGQLPRDRAAPRAPTSAGSCTCTATFPGILARLNGVLSGDGINIAAQYLQTRTDVGYAITDIDTRASASVVDRLRSIEGTIRCRFAALIPVRCHSRLGRSHIP